MLLWRVVIERRRQREEGISNMLLENEGELIIRNNRPCCCKWLYNSCSLFIPISVWCSFFLYDKFPPYSHYAVAAYVGVIPLLLFIGLFLIDNYQRREIIDTREELLNILLGSDICEDDNILNVCCSICLVDIELGERYSRLRCDHTYHTDCIRTWLLIKNNCPLCRIVINN